MKKRKNGRAGRLPAAAAGGVLCLCLLLAGCAAGKQESPAATPEPQIQPAPEDTQAGALDVPAGNADSTMSNNELLFLEDMPWQDNSLDAYSALTNVPLRYTEDGEDGDAVEGGACIYLLGEDGAAVFKKHLSQEREKCWDELKTVTDQGEETSRRLLFWEGQLNQAWAVGTQAGSGYLMMNIEYGEAGYRYLFFKSDGEKRLSEGFYADFLDRSDYEFPRQMAVDGEGNLHMITDRLSDGSVHYYIAGPDGELLREVTPGGGFPRDLELRLFDLYDGRVGLKLGGELRLADPQGEGLELLAKGEPLWKDFILQDEGTLLYCDGTGLYRSGLLGENPELLYTWSNHGVSASRIEAMRTAPEGEIGLIYVDSQGSNYLKLEPTREEVSLREITFAVRAGSAGKYQSAAAAFQKKYPACRVKLVSLAYGDTSLLTELIAGEGPVLVDTTLTGFESHGDWWDSLEELPIREGREDLYVSKALDLGRIDGTLRGVVTDFSLTTGITFRQEPEDWDYDAFLACFDEEDASLKSVYNPMSGSDGLVFVGNFYGSLEDSPLFDADLGETYFQGESFGKIARLAQIFMEGKRQGSPDALKSGESPMGVVSLRRPEDLACLRIWGGEALRMTGLPSGEGACHYIEGGSPIALRAGASPEEKQIARSFLLFLLSYDYQREAAGEGEQSGFSMSVRKDVLDWQIASMNEYTFTGLNGYPQFYLEDQADPARDGETLYDLLEKAKPRKNLPRELTDILMEELNIFLTGGQTQEALVEHLENRVGLYLDER